MGIIAESISIVRGPIAALESIDEALAKAATSQDRYWLPELLRLRGDFLLASPSSNQSIEMVEQQAEQSYYEALQLSRSLGGRTLELRAAASLARLWIERGQRARARALLKPIYDWFSEGAGTPDLQAAKALLQQLN